MVNTVQSRVTSSVIPHDQNLSEYKNKTTFTAKKIIFVEITISLNVF